MKKLIAALVLLLPLSVMAKSTTQEFTAGWDKFSEPLDYSKSSVKWSVAKSGGLTVTYSLVGATPNKLYQTTIAFFNQCAAGLASFGQYTTEQTNCSTITRQGVTAGDTGVELGVIRTDLNGDGVYTITLSPITPGTYDVEFVVRDGVGCTLTGGGSDCDIDFQSPGPTFDTTTAIVIP
jgi:hypothetical protein